MIQVAGPWKHVRVQGHRAGTMPAVRQTIDPLQFTVNGGSQPKGVEPVPQVLERAQLRRIARAGGKEPIERGLGAIIPAVQAGADACLADEFD